MPEKTLLEYGESIEKVIAWAKLVSAAHRITSTVADTARYEPDALSILAEARKAVAADISATITRVEKRLAANA